MNKFVVFIFLVIGFTTFFPCYSMPEGKYEPVTTKTPPPSKTPILISENKYLGKFVPARVRGNYLVPISASVLAPSGEGTQGSEATGTGKYTFEIYNSHEVDIVCTVTKRICMNVNDQHSCGNFQQTFMIPTKKKVYDINIPLSNTYIYKQKGENKTESSIIFEGCIDSRLGNVLLNNGTVIVR